MARYVVCHDVTDSRRRTRVAAVLSAHGSRRQKSVFELVVGPELLEDCLDQICALLDPTKDSVAAYRLCRRCAGDRLYVGQGDHPIGEEEVFIV